MLPQDWAQAAWGIMPSPISSIWTPGRSGPGSSVRDEYLEKFIFHNKIFVTRLNAVFPKVDEIRQDPVIRPIPRILRQHPLPSG